MAPNSIILSVLFLLLLSISPSIGSGDAMRFAKNHLKEAFGYLSENYTSIDADAYDEALASALRKYQSFYGLNISGRIEPDTLMMMSRPRGDIPDHSSENNITLQYSFFPGNPKWPQSKRRLKYMFITNTPIRFKKVSMAISRAFSTWSGVTNFTFKMVAGHFRPPEIGIGFYRREHGCSMPFDGRGGEVAHTFSPPSGIMHFDADEDWGTVQAPNILDLESIALHEIGHVLGLHHSDRPNAVMYPTFGYGRIKRELDQDDIDGIRALYAG